MKKVIFAGILLFSSSYLFAQNASTAAYVSTSAPVAQNVSTATAVSTSAVSGEAAAVPASLPVSNSSVDDVINNAQKDIAAAMADSAPVVQDNAPKQAPAVKQNAPAKQDSAINADLGSLKFFIDYNLIFRALSYSNVDYTRAQGSEASGSVFSQYMTLDFTGQFENTIEMNARVASYGISGKTDGLFLSPYSSNDYSAFIQTAYVTFKNGDNKAFIPFSISAGKQNITAGSGLIIDSNQVGLAGVRANAEFFNYFAVDAFAAKIDTLDFDVYGGNISLKTAPTFELGVYSERNNSGYEFSQGVQSSTTTGYDNKNFYDFRIYNKDKKYNYNIEIAQQGGQRFITSTDTVNYNSMAFLFQGGMSGRVLDMKTNAGLLFSYTNSTEGNVFNPTFARRYNGIGRVGFGTLFAANNSDSFIALPDGFAGINTIGANLDVSPLKALTTGAAVYFYSASYAPAEASGAGLAQLFGAKADLGNEIDVFLKYNYLKYFDAGITFAIYMPPSDPNNVFANHDNSYLIQFEVNAKF